MKKSLYLMIPAIIAATGCGSTAALSSGQRFNDGIYYAGQDKKPVSVQTDDQEVNDLVARTKESEIYLFGNEKADTVVIPENKSAVINFNNSAISSITITDDPFEQAWYSGYALLPVTAWAVTWSTWWDPWYWDPWYYGASWYRNPWYSGRWWDPWYWNPWYWDPWYYHRPYWSYDPYWHHHHHHHHPGIWDHRWHGRDVYYGSRNSTGSFGSRSSAGQRRRSGVHSRAADGGRIPVAAAGSNTSTGLPSPGSRRPLPLSHSAVSVTLLPAAYSRTGSSFPATPG